MAGALGSLVVSLEANMAKFTSDMGKAVDIAERSMSKISSAFASLGVAVSIKGIEEFVVSNIKAADGMAKAAIKAGTSVEAFSQLGYAAKTSGVDVDSLSMAMRYMETAISKGDTVKAFDAIGLSVAGLRRLSPDQQLEAIADAFKKTEDPATRARAATELFGRAGFNLLPLLEQGAQGIADLRKQADDLGITLDNVAAQSAVAANDAITRLESSMSSLGRTIALAVAPGLSKFADWLRVGWGGGSEIENYERLLKNLASIRQGMISSAQGPGGRMVDPAAFAQVNQDINSVVSLLTAARAKTLANLPDLSSTTKPAKGYEDTAKSDVQRTQLANQLRAIQDSIKAQDDAMRLGNIRLDADYDHGLVSLQNYADEKQSILDKNNVATQAYYDQEIADIKRAIPLMKDENQQAQARGTLQEVIDAQLRDQDKYLQDNLTLHNKLTDETKRYNDQLKQLDISYDTMNGDTAAATRLQIELDDALLRTRLQTEGNTAALAKLAAVEHDRMLHAQTDLKSGVQRAASDYAKSLQNVAKAGEDITNKMFSDMTDALVSFVQTGKLSFRSLVDDIIAGMIRIIVEQQIMKPLTDWFGSLIGGGGGFLGGLFGGGGAGALAAGGTDLADIGSFAGFAAAGGPTIANRSYVVGENGPELWMPKSAGTVIPNGALAGGGIVYAPTINVDARSDRAQVQAEVTRAVQDGNRKLLAQLTRYNQGLRV